MLRWQEREVRLPIDYSVASLRRITDECRDSAYEEEVNQLSALLQETTTIADGETRKEKLDEIKDKLGELKDEVSDESPLEQRLTSLAPKRKNLFQSVSSIFSRVNVSSPFMTRRGENNESRGTNLENLDNAEYFLQVRKCEERRDIFGIDISRYSYIAESFNGERELLQNLEWLNLSNEHKDSVLRSFRDVRDRNLTESKNTLLATIKEPYHSILSRVFTAAKYGLASLGAIIGGIIGLALGIGVGALVVGVAALVVGVAALVVGVAALVAAVVGVAGLTHGINKGAEFAYRLQRKITT